MKPPIPPGYHRCKYCDAIAVEKHSWYCAEHLARRKERQRLSRERGEPEQMRARALAENNSLSNATLRDRIDYLEDQVKYLLEKLA